MTRLLRALFRRLTPGLVRRAIVLLLLAGLWLAWKFWPPRPLREWVVNPSTVPAVPRSSSLAASADGQTVALAYHWAVTRISGEQPSVRVLDVVSGRERCRLTQKSDEHLQSLSPDGRWLVLQSVYGKASIWDAATGSCAAGPDAVPGGFTAPVTFLPDGHRCLIGRRDYGLTLWDLASNRAVATLPGAAGPGIVTPDGRTLMTAGRQSVLLWNVETGEPVTTPRLVADIDEWPYDIAITPDGRRLAVVVRQTLPPPVDPIDRVVRNVLLFDWPSGTAAGVLRLHDTSVIPLPDGADTRVRFSADGRLLWVHGLTVAALWDVAANPPREVTPPARRRPGRPVRRFHRNPPPLRDRRECLLSSTGTMIVADGDKSGTLDIFEPGTPDRQITVALPADAVDYIPTRFSPDGRLLAVHALLNRPMAPNNIRDLIHFLRFGAPQTREQFVVCLFDTATGRPHGIFPVEDTGDSLVVAFDPDGQSVWTVEPLGSLRARQWAIPTGWPPPWLLAATIGGLVLIAVDWRRSMSYR